MIRPSVSYSQWTSERAMADKAYNNPRLFVFPTRGIQQGMSREDRQRNYGVSRVRQSVERVIRRVRSFQIFIFMLIVYFRVRS